MLDTTVDVRYDVAVIILKEDVELSKTIQIAHLPEENAACPDGRNMIFSGWGLDITRPFLDRTMNGSLWAVMLECLDNKKCTILDDVPDKENMMCVGDSENPLNNLCVEDTGGKYFIMHIFLFLE